MINCSNCDTTIEQTFCPNCGQKHTNKRITLWGLFTDFWDSLFSFDKSLLVNFKMLLFNPAFIVKNYWGGYSNYYMSPGRLLIIASLFLGINLLFFNNAFLGLKISAVNFSAQLGFLFILIPLLTISSFIAYIKFKRNLIEHTVMNIYIFCMWLTVFSLISIAVSFFALNFLKYPLLILFLIVVFIWNSLVFELTAGKRIVYVFLNVFVFSLLIGGFGYLIINSKGM